MPDVTLTLLSKPGCHLCDDAREVVASVLSEFPAGTSQSVAFAETSILDDAELLDRYVEEIPVVLINERIHTIWRVDPDRLRFALKHALDSTQEGNA